MTPTPARHLLSARDLRFAYRASAEILRGVDLDLAPGERVALLGPNGAGKSTLLHAILGPEALGHQPLRGQLLLGGEALTRRPLLRARQVAFLPQQLPQNLGMSVEQVVRLGRYPHSGPFGDLGHQGEEAVEQALQRCGLVDMRRRPVDDLSGGERQRVFLASALAQQTPLLLLDEPTSALDIQYALDLMAILAELTDAQPRAVLMATHDLNLAARHCTRLVVMHRGQIVADGLPADVLTPSMLAQVYGIEATLLRDPHTGSPVVCPTGRAHPTPTDQRGTT